MIINAQLAKIEQSGGDVNVDLEMPRAYKGWTTSSTSKTCYWKGGLGYSNADIMAKLNTMLSWLPDGDYEFYGVIIYWNSTDGRTIYGTHELLSGLASNRTLALRASNGVITNVTDVSISGKIAVAIPDYTGTVLLNAGSDSTGNTYWDIGITKLVKL